VQEKKNTLFSPNWSIISVSQQLFWHQIYEEEVWSLQPPRRYVMSSDQIKPPLSDYISTISDFASSRNYRPLIGSVNLAKARILVERNRCRGIGDLLFLTGPLSYLYHLSGQSCQIFLYALSDRGIVLNNHPALYKQSPLFGPIEYDQLPLYDYHWFVGSVTEYDCESDQLNVYDALFRQLGLDYKKIDEGWKRPTASLTQDDLKNLNAFFFFCNEDRKIDFRKEGYYVVAPLCVSSLRSAPYSAWLKIIQSMSQRRPTFVIGKIHESIPSTDMDIGQFNSALCGLGPNVINIMGDTPLRTIMSIISKAVCFVGLDSGPLYIAQSLRTPAVSVWGPHHPGVRLGYDKEYMDLAVWNKNACRSCPCFAYTGFPKDLCSHGENQVVCDVLAAVDVELVMANIDKVESNRRTNIGPFHRQKIDAV
jgi:hypothetical protein